MAAPAAARLELGEHRARNLMGIAKGLGGGYQPIGAGVGRAKYLMPSRRLGLPRMATLSRGHHGLAAALAVPGRDAASTGWSRMCRRWARGSSQRWPTALLTIPSCGEIRGRGLFMAVEWWRIATPRRRSIRDPQSTARHQARGDGAGFMVYPMGGNDRRRAWRSRHAGAALHRRFCHCRRSWSGGADRHRRGLDGIGATTLTLSTGRKPINQRETMKQAPKLLAETTSLPLCGDRSAARSSVITIGTGGVTGVDVRGGGRDLPPRQTKDRQKRTESADR